MAWRHDVPPRAARMVISNMIGRFHLFLGHWAPKKQNQGALGKIQFCAGLGRLYRVKSPGQRLRVGVPRETNDRSARNTFFPSESQAFVDWKSGIHVEAAAGARRKHTPAIFETRWQVEFVHKRSD